MHGITEAGSVRASQWRREHAEDTVSHLAGPGFLIDQSKHNEKRTQHVSPWPD